MGNDTRRSRAKEHWYAANLQAWCEAVPHPFAALTARDVHLAADRTERAFYGLWPSVEAFRAEFLEWALAPASERSTPQSTIEALQLMRELLVAGHSPPDLIRAAVVNDITEYRDDPVLSAAQRVTFAAIASATTDDEVRDAVRDQYDAILRSLLEVYLPVLEAWRRRPRHPWAVEEIALAIMYLVDGALLHAMFDERLGADQVADLVLTLLAGTTEPDAQERIDFDAFADATLRPGPGETWQPDSSAERAIVRLHRDGGWRAVTVAGVAARSGRSEELIRRAFDPVPAGFAEVIWADLAETVAETDPPDLPTLLHHIHDLAHHHEEATHAYLLVLPYRDVPSPLGRLIAGFLEGETASADAEHLSSATLGIALGPDSRGGSRDTRIRALDRLARARGRTLRHTDVMTVIRVQTEPGRLDAAARSTLSEALTDSVLDVEVGDRNDLARAGIMVLYDEVPADRWAVGGRHDDSFVGGGGRILLDVSVMAADWSATRREELLGRLAADIAGALGLDATDLTTCWILLRVVADGSWGYAGGVIRAADIVGVFGEPHGAEVRARLTGDGPI